MRKNNLKSSLKAWFKYHYKADNQKYEYRKRFLSALLLLCRHANIDYSRQNLNDDLLLKKLLKEFDSLSYSELYKIFLIKHGN